MKLKKSLGQHVLINQRLLQKITLSLGEIKDRPVVEIGGGTGQLSQFLLPAKKLIVYEIAENLAALLREKFPKIEVINQDFLQAELEKFKHNYLLIGNIPYFLTGRILRKVLREQNYPKAAVLTLQKEYGEKMLGRPKPNFWSNWLKVWGEISKVCSIKAKNFLPAPQVDSIAIKIEFFRRPLLDEPENFAKFLKTVFRQPKRTVRNNLKHRFNSFSLSDQTAIKAIENLRPHQLNFQQIFELYDCLKKRGDFLPC